MCVCTLDDKENSLFKHDQFLRSFQVFKSYTAAINGNERYKIKTLERALETGRV